MLAKPYTDVNWTKGIDQKTGRPLDYDPAKDIQTYAGVGNLVPGEPLKKVCPSLLGGNNYWPSSFSGSTKLNYIPSVSNCSTISIDREKHNAERGWNGGLMAWKRHGSARWSLELAGGDTIGLRVDRQGATIWRGTLSGTRAARLRPIEPARAASIQEEIAALPRVDQSIKRRDVAEVTGFAQCPVERAQTVVN